MNNTLTQADLNRVVYELRDCEFKPINCKWKAASGHSGGWRVVRGTCPVEELLGKSGNRILFKTLQAARKRANSMNLKLSQGPTFYLTT